MGMKEIWDGNDLPPVGCEVLAELSSCTHHPDKGWVRHKVTGYRIHPASDAVPETTSRLHRRISVMLGATSDSRSSTNERNLDDVRPLDWRK